MINIEMWKDIEGYNGDYQISTLGNVKSLKRNSTRLLKETKNPKGYSIIGLYIHGTKTSLTVHRLVMLTFKGYSVMEVNHINGDKSDNRLINLEYVTLRENMNHRFKYIKKQKRYGISFQKSADKYSAQLHTKRKKKHLGLFDNKEDAYNAFYIAYLNYHKTPPWDTNDKT